MGKDNKKHSKKDAASEDILDLARTSLKKFRKVTREIGKLSTGQKLVGGLALAAAGLAYLATREPADATEEPATAALAPAEEDQELTRKSAKRLRSSAKE